MPAPEIASDTAAFATVTPVADPDLPSLVGMDRDELQDALGQIGVPERQRRMRATQLWYWIYVRGVTDFSAMTNMSKDVRQTLAAHYTLARPEMKMNKTGALLAGAATVATGGLNLLAKGASDRKSGREGECLTLIRELGGHAEIGLDLTDTASEKMRDDRTR